MTLEQLAELGKIAERLIYFSNCAKEYTKTGRLVLAKSATVNAVRQARLIQASGLEIKNA